MELFDSVSNFFFRTSSANVAYAKKGMAPGDFVLEVKYHKILGKAPLSVGCVAYGDAFDQIKPVRYMKLWDVLAIIGNAPVKLESDTTEEVEEVRINTPSGRLTGLVHLRTIVFRKNPDDQVVETMVEPYRISSMKNGFLESLTLESMEKIGMIGRKRARYTPVRNYFRTKGVPVLAVMRYGFNGGGGCPGCGDDFIGSPVLWAIPLELDCEVNYEFFEKGKNHRAYTATIARISSGVVLEKFEVEYKPASAAQEGNTGIPSQDTLEWRARYQVALNKGHRKQWAKVLASRGASG